MFGASIVTLSHDAYTSGSAPVASLPQYGMPFNYHYNQNEFVSANQFEYASSAPETDRANLGGFSTILHIATYTRNSVQVSRIDNGATTMRAFFTSYYGVA